jgi:Trypsin-like peptidase domain
MSITTIPIVRKSIFKPQKHVFAIIGCSAGSKSITEGCRLFGTAFSFAPNLFLTAEHVISSAMEKAGVSLVEQTQDGNEYHKIDKVERFPEVDVAVLTAVISNAVPMRFSETVLPHLESVRTNGFPYGMDPITGRIQFRSFMGGISGHQRWNGLTGRPMVYELPFQCDRGLSGAPIWVSGRGEGSPVVKGMIFGNSRTEMIVFSESEKDSSTQEVRTIEKIEAMRLGLAVTSDSIMSLVIPSLSKSIIDIVTENGLRVE